jgi:hypothetical protein
MVIRRYEISSSCLYENSEDNRSQERLITEETETERGGQEQPTAVTGTITYIYICIVTGINQEKERERMTTCGKYPTHKMSLRKIPMTNVTTSQRLKYPIAIYLSVNDDLFIFNYRYQNCNVLP